MQLRYAMGDGLGIGALWIPDHPASLGVVRGMDLPIDPHK